MHQELNPETNYIILCHAELRSTQTDVCLHHHSELIDYGLEFS